MKTTLKRHSLLFILLVTTLFVGCVDHDEPQLGKEGLNVKVNLQLSASDAQVVSTRSNLDAVMSNIDNVHVLVFESQSDGVARDEDQVIFRHYLDYGIEQNIYLRSGEKYNIFVVANLDQSNVNIGNSATFFDDVQTLAHLRAKYIIASSRSVEQIGKMVMCTENVVPLDLPAIGEANIRIPLSRLNTKVICNLYNKVTSAINFGVTSGVFPTSWNVVNTPKSSFLLCRPVVEGSETHDYPMNGVDDEAIESNFTQSQAQVLPPVESGIISHNGNYYTKQTFHLFIFENRRGTNTAIQAAIQRKELALPFSTFIQLTSYTSESKVLVHSIHPGKGRGTDPEAPDDITNFDIDRSCIYHMNIYINGKDNVQYDSRCEYLDQHVIFTLPDINRIDGHYMDVPSYLAGMNGYAKLQSGTCDVNGNGEIIYTSVDGKQVPQNLHLMEDTDPDEQRWLRFSYYNPYNSTKAKTSIYLNLNDDVDSHSGATPIMHFNENIPQGAVTTAGNPIKRTAVIKVGYVVGSENEADYDEGVGKGLESVFYVPISQYSIKTVGQVGGYDGESYTSLLGVESVEEYTFQYYYREPDPDIVNAGPPWLYKSGLVNHNQAYDGKKATTDHYNDYRSQFTSAIPPKRTVGGYNPVFNTNAADYCMRKNRDENYDGIISGDEIKWYLPTPVQLMQIRSWQDNLKYSFDMVTPFASPYWSTNEASATQAFAMDFSLSQVASFEKTERHSIRCVRDIPGTSGGNMIYPSGGHIVVDLTGNFPLSSLTDKATDGWTDNDIRSPQGNTQMQTYFMVSRWYVTENTNHTGTAQYQTSNGKYSCADYFESDIGGWRLPTQQELSFVYAYSGLLENMMETNYGATGYHPFIQDTHWGSTNDGNNSTFWELNFATGLSQVNKKGAGYFRCVRYCTKFEMESYPKP